MPTAWKINSPPADAGWQRSLARAVRDPGELLRELQLSPQGLPRDHHLLQQFPVLVPRSYLNRMQPGNPDDPLLRQILPLAGEALETAGFSADPVGDSAARLQPGLLQKYHGRVLLIAHGSCAVHCRYCFRREYPYQAEPRAPSDWEPALQAIASDPTVHEVILSGGDPLLLSDRRLSGLLDRLEEIGHLRRLRIHSRLPIVLPDRVTADLTELLTATRLRSVMVVHANHPQELVSDCAEALARLVGAGISVLNQAVLLRGINDTPDPLTELCERCVDLGVLPYYLHQLDRVRGAAHYEVPVETGLKLIEELRARLPGYAVPRYVREDSGARFKTPLPDDRDVPRSAP